MMMVIKGNQYRFVLFARSDGPVIVGDDAMFG